LFFIKNVFFYGLLTWSIIVLFEKWGIREQMSGRAPNRIIQQAVECNFCFAHHITFICVIPEFIGCFNFRFLLIPLFVATAINKCLN
tara:strand:+ start:288 stop:548 length:261 start_codon:yes stop_codon:yes gene_type:complete